VNSVRSLRQDYDDALDELTQKDAEIERLREALPTDAELRRLKEHAHALCGDSTRSWRQFGQHIVAIAERVEHARAALEGGSDAVPS